MRPRVPGVGGYGAELSAAWADHLAPRKPDALTVVSTFAGCGGSSLGYSMAGYHEIGAVEWDDHAAYCFARNFPGVKLHHGDICDVDPSWLPMAPGELDVLDGSPPCQGFSTSGKRRIGDERNDLFRQYARLLGEWQPRAFVMENVSGLVTGKMRLLFVEMLRVLKTAGPGYRVAAKLLDARYFRVPQKRQRLIFIGLRADLGAEPTHPEALSRPLTVRDAWGDLSEPGEYLLHSGKGAKLVPLIPPGQNGASILRGAGRSGSYWDMWRLSWDQPANTLLRSYNQSSAAIHPVEHRKLGTREASRLQSFPDEYDWGASTCLQIHERIGNSVPPMMMRAIAAHLRDQLDRIDGR